MSEIVFVGRKSTIISRQSLPMKSRIELYGKKKKHEEKMNMNTVFRKPKKDDIAEIEAFKKEFEENNSGMDGTGILFRSSAEEWLEYVSDLERRDNPNSIPCLQYGLFDKESRRLLGFIQVRLELKGYLVEFGGHIGYCVRPSERRKGYAKQMLRQALHVCQDEGLDKVMITCLEDNIGSAKTIESCGGVFEKIVYDDMNYKANMKRYWITLEKKDNQ